MCVNYIIGFEAHDGSVEWLFLINGTGSRLKSCLLTS